MDAYLFVESLDPFESNDVSQFYDLAAALAREGKPVTLFLVQNGVLAARRGARTGSFGALSQLGVEVLADEFALRERGIRTEGLAPGVRAAPLDVVLDRLVEGRKALWH